MARWINLAGYQLVWFACVMGAAHGWLWLGVGAAVFFIVLQLFESREPQADIWTLLLAIGLGVVVDGGLQASGLLRYAAPQPALGAPLWILAIWAAFGMTLNHSLALLRNKPAWAALFGGLGAPLAYLAAARGFGAVAFAEPAWVGLVVLACTWAVVMILFSHLLARLRTLDVGTPG